MLNFRKVFFVFVLAIFLLWPLSGMAQAQPIELYFFEGQGCSHCAKMKSYIEGLKQDYPNLKVYDFEVYFDKENRAFFQKMAEAYKTDTSGVPTIFIDNEVIVGENFEKVKNAVEKCFQETCISPIQKINQGENSSNINVSIDGYLPISKQKNEIIGWIVIGILGFVGLGLIFFFFKKRFKKRK